MVRWSLLLFTLGTLWLLFFGPSPGWVALGLFGFLFGSLATTLAFAHARIASSARHEDVAVHASSTKPPGPDAPDPTDDPIRR